MKKILEIKNLWIYFILLASSILLFGEIINDRFTMHDLEVYYRTAARMIDGEELYRIAADGHYVYKYSPTAALYFVPFALLPFPVAKVIFWGLLTALTIVVLRVLFNLAQEAFPGINNRNRNILLVAFLAVGAHVHREWHLGQVNFVLLSLYIFMLVFLMKQKSLPAGVLLAVSLFLKPFGLIFYPYLLLKGKFKTVLTSLGAIMILALLPMVFYPSWHQYTLLNQSWLTELSIELGAKQNLMAEANHTIFSVLARYSPLQYLLATSSSIKIYQLILLGIIGLCFLSFMQMGKKVKNGLVAEVAVLIALVPLFAFTSQNAFLFTLPAIVLVLYNYPQLPPAGKYMTVASCLLIGANIRDLMGREIYNLFENASVYTFGTLLLLAMLFLIRRNRQNEINQTHESRGSILHA
ncbi:glycosyltransferase family 87 protein [Pontibacter locisalis]|uniref:Glycosyltransferase family 87 protein n=1 Tax=Pontibacter locisalis TaxID=1719035 RepID=A0ABW5IT01_9BACT